MIRLFLLFSLLNISGFTQESRKLEIHTDYQLLKYNYLQFGIGFSPKNHLVSINRNNESFSFIGYRLNYSDNLDNHDWGLALQSIVIGGKFDNITAFGIELNMKNVEHRNHFGFKPMIGISLPYFNLMYAYNFDFYSIKEARISQHELILGISINVLKW
jgi:hypothetical protein